MKKIGLAAIFIFSACTRTSPLTTSRWSGIGERPQFEANLTDSKKTSAAGEQVEIQAQTLSGFRVEGAFVKSVRNDSNKVVFQSLNLAKEITPFKQLKASRLEKKKNQIWSDFLKTHSDYNQEKLLSPLEIVFISKNDILPVLRAVTELKSGQIRSTWISDQGDIISTEYSGSGLTDIIESPSFVFELGPKKSPLSSVLLARKPLPIGLSDFNIEVSTLSKSKITLPGTLEFSTTDERFDQVQAFYYSHQIMTWFKQKLGPQFSIPLRIVTHLGYPEKTNAAFYFQNQIRLGTGDDVAYSHIPWDPSIVMHETSHALIDAISRLPFQGEGGSINEGFADTFTTFYLNNPWLGENSYLLSSFKRSVDLNLRLSDKNGGLYHDSAIVSGFFWQLRKTISEEKVLLLAMRILNRLGPQSDFADFQTCLLEQVNLLASENLITSTEQKNIQLVAKERELL